jgi:hypothetical protein
MSKIDAQLISLVIGGFLAWATFQQARFQRETLRNQLFDRRAGVFDAARELMREVLREGTVSRDGLDAYMRGTLDAVFLFDDHALIEYLELVRSEAVRLMACSEANRRDPSDAVTSGRLDQEHGLVTWFSSEFRRLHEHFEGHLRVRL